MSERTHCRKGARDYGLTTDFALCKITTVLSRTAMDRGIPAREAAGPTNRYHVILEDEA